MTANKSQADKNGWDVFVEVEQCVNTLMQASLHEPIIAGKVQIKSTKKKSLKVPVYLSNLRKLATSPLPTFYVLMDFSEGYPPSRAFIRHVDDALIREILERVNEHLISGKRDKLNHLRMQIDFGKGVEISLKDPTSFKAQIMKSVGNDLAQYTERKLKFLKAVGYEDGAHVMRFTIQGIENLRAQADATLGIGGGVEISDVQFATTRFGLEDPLSRADFPAMLMQFNPCEPSASGTLAFRSPRTGKVVQLEASAYFSGIQGWLPEGMRKIRFNCGMFDWITTQDGSHTSFISTLDPEAPVNLDDLASYLQIICLLRNPEDLHIDIDFSGFKNTFTVKNGTSLSDYSGMLEVADTLFKTKMQFGDRAPLKVSANELFRSRQIISDFHAFLNNDAEASISFSDDVSEPFEAVFLVPTSLRIGGKIYLTIMA
ncbi:hypothetical protein AO263_33955, partial [Pseudomonas sp. NZIPFR-PS5]